MKIYDSDSIYLSMRDYWFLVINELEFQKEFAIKNYYRSRSAIKVVWYHDNLLNIPYGEIMHNVSIKKLKRCYYKKIYTREDLDGRDFIDPGIARIIKLGWARNYPSYR